MKKTAITALISAFIMTANLYCFDLIEDTFEFIFDDLAQIIGIVVIIAAVLFFIKKKSKKNNNY
ncbi:hypothetical protein [uncultured Brachyspira sp.]|uniref:hypothetical protein n=1 Tax=uncultured Brachyspira sp. TaxID=221953 RepID=UPI0025E9DB51|nr:hypothetical protein [uncultured Brachyspira sp.]